MAEDFTQLRICGHVLLSLFGCVKRYVSMMVASASPSLVLFILCPSAVLFFVVDSLSLKSCGSIAQCYNGDYEITDDSSNCHCHPGWHGDSCEYCGGKMRYSLFLVIIYPTWMSRITFPMMHLFYLHQSSFRKKVYRHCFCRQFSRSLLHLA